MEDNIENNTLNTENEDYSENHEYVKNEPYSIPTTGPDIKVSDKNKTTKGWLKSVALILACAIVGGVSGYFGSSLSAKNSLSESGSETEIRESSGQTVVHTTYVESVSGKDAAAVYRENVNSTVGITTSIKTNYFGYVSSTPASGSGFILTKDGYVLTNYHVVEDASEIKVTTYDGTEYDATLIGYDDNNDIAVLKVDANDLSPVVLGDSDNLSIGDTVVAIGNPLGELTFSLTQGVVSALDREVTFSNGLTMDLIQTDCAINNGSSGGALFNMNGEVVGITNAKYSGQTSSSSAAIESIAFAIPISHVKNIVEDIISKGYYAKPYIGISVANVSNESIAYGLPKGAAVKSVTKDGPADKAGIETNDIITSADGNEIGTYTELIEYIGTKSPDDTVILTVYRQGEYKEISVTVGEQIQSVNDNNNSQENGNNQDQGSPNGFNQFPSFPFGGFSNGNNF